MLGLTPLDLGAFATFALTWLCYHAVLEWSPYAERNLNHVMDRYRHAWMRQMQNREVRIVDTQITASLQNGSAFFASSSLFAIGGSLALLRSTGDVQKVLADLPLGIDPTPGTWELKALGLTVMFVYAFFKFAWSYRLFNYAAIMMGAVPPAAMQGRSDGSRHRRPHGTAAHHRRPPLQPRPAGAVFRAGLSGLVRQCLGADRNDHRRAGGHAAPPARSGVRQSCSATTRSAALQ